MEISPTDSVIGAAVTGISLKVPPADAEIETIEKALERYGVLVFPAQDVTPEEQVAFTRCFGELESTDLPAAQYPGIPEIFVVGNVGKALVAFAPLSEGGELEWHTDHIQQETPARASLMIAKEVPGEGGDTLFACMYTAFDALEPDSRALAETLNTRNSISGLDYYLLEQNLGDDDEKPALPGASAHDPKARVRPLVRPHPLSGRKSLYFGNHITTGIVGWDDQKARAYLANLTSHACQNAFQYRHRWSVGDAVLWDNRRVLHAGTPYDVVNARRLMHRTTLNETESIPLAG